MIENVRIEKIRRVAQGEQMRQKAQCVSKTSITDRDPAEEMGADQKINDRQIFRTGVTEIKRQSGRTSGSMRTVEQSLLDFRLGRNLSDDHRNGETFPKRMSNQILCADDFAPEQRIFLFARHENENPSETEAEMFERANGDDG